MSITNQQIADLMSQVIKSHDDTTKTLIASMEAATMRDEKNHQGFRDATTELAKAVALLQERQERHSRNWDQLWKVVLAAVIIPLATTIVLLAIN